MNRDRGGSVKKVDVKKEREKEEIYAYKQNCLK